MDPDFSEHEQRAELFEELAKWLFLRCGAKGMSVDDARDVSRIALYKLMKNWRQLKAEYGVNSMKGWLETTAYREYLKIITRERRNQTDSLTAPAQNSGGEDEGVTQTLGDRIESEGFGSLPPVHADDLELVKEVMSLMPSRCQLKKRAGLDLCGERCSILSRRYVSEEKKIPVRELSVEFKVPHGTMNDWLGSCEDHFKALWKDHS